MSSTNKSSRPKRQYKLGVRAASAERTRESILDAAVEAFRDRWYDEVTLADVAREAGVSQQTVVNHFGSKEDLYLVGVRERWAPAVNEVRSRVAPGDIASIVDTVCDDYAATGAETLRTLALAERSPVLAEIVRQGRLSHVAWVTTALGTLLDPLDDAARARAINLCATVLDVRTWTQVRNPESDDDTRADMGSLLRSVVDSARSQP